MSGRLSRRGAGNEEGTKPMNRSPTTIRLPVPRQGSRILRLSLLPAVACLFACAEDYFFLPLPPEACEDIPPQTVFVGETAVVRPCFKDPEGEPLVLTASSSDVEAATVNVKGPAVEIAGRSPGRATITVVATDPDDLTAEVKFEVVVPNRPPRVCGQVPRQEMFVRQSRLIEPCFEDPEGEELTLAASSSDVDVATVIVLGRSFRIAAVSPGTAVITVSATDPGGMAALLDVQVLVPNRAPVSRGSPGPATVMRGDAREWDLGDYFVDPDGQPLIYSARSANPGIATAAVADSTTLVVTGVASGMTTITVTATDPGGLTATTAFEVTVQEAAPRAVSPRGFAAAKARWPAPSRWRPVYAVLEGDFRLPRAGHPSPPSWNAGGGSPPPTFPRIG